MNTVLFIHSCIRKESRTYRLAKEYIDTLMQDNKNRLIERDVTKLGLTPIDEEFLQKRDQAIEQLNYTGIDFDYAREFADADMIIIAAPYWDCSFPSFLKLYFEHIMITDITIGYSPTGKMLKLCQANRLVYITTSGGYIRKHSGVQIQIEELCALFGIGDVRFYCAEALDMFPDKAEYLLHRKLIEILSEKETSTRIRIPDRKIPQIEDYEITGLDEELVSLSEFGFIISSQYYDQGFSGAAKDCYVRKTVAEMLVNARELLPKGYNFKIFDGYRPIRIQQNLWDHFREDIIKNEPGLSEAEVDVKASFFVSRPSYDELHPSLHNTGGAVDLSIVDDNGEDLDMGTDFDSFKETSFTDYYEKDNSNLAARENRRMLYNVMLQSGFTNLPSEWWHYDYGTKFWAYYKKRSALYKGILDMVMPEQLT